MHGWQAARDSLPLAASSAHRSRSTLEAVLPAARLLGVRQDAACHEVGHVTSERTARLCGDHLEHCYEALRLTTHGTTCVSVAFHTTAPPATCTGTGGATGSSGAAGGHACSSGPDGAAGQLLVCGTSANSIAVFNAAAPACIAQHSKGPRRYSTVFTPSLAHVAVFGDPLAPAIELQLCAQGKFAFLEGHTVEVRCVDITPHGSLAISGGRGSQAFLWQVLQAPAPTTSQAGSAAAPAGPAPAGEPVVLRHALAWHASNTQIKCCCLSADGGWAATGGSDGAVVLWDLSALLPGEQALAAALAAARASEAGGGSSGGGAAVRRPSSNSSCMAAAPGQVQQAACWQLGRDHATCIALARDGSVLAVGTRSGGVHVVASCSTAARQLVQLPSRHSEACKVRCAALSPDATKLATTADDARLVLWDVARGSCLLAIHEHTKAVRGCCWSPDGKHIATVGDDSLLCVLDVMLLHSRSGNSGSAAKGGAAAPAGTTPGSSSKRGSRLLRMPLRLNGAAALTAGDAAAAAEAEEAGEGVVASSVPPHPQLQRIDVSLVKERLLACMPLPQPASTCASSFNGTAAAAAAAAGDAVSDGVLCAGHTGQLLLLPPGCAAAVSTGLHVGSGIACCSFDGGVVAAARRDGAVTVVSCSPASAAIGTSVTVTSTAGSTIGATPAPPAAAARRVSGGGQGPFAAAPSAISAAAAAAALAAAAGGHPAELPAAVSTKLDMVVLGISVCRALGRVALVGCERKATQTGVAHLWEFDPSVRPAAQPPGGAGAGGARRAGLGASGSRSLLDRHESSRSLLSSEDSGLSDGGTTSPSRLSMDLDGALTPAPPRGSAGGFGAFWDNLGAGLHHPKGGGGRAAGKGGGGTAAGGGHQHHAAANLRLSSGTELGLSAASAGVLGRSVGPAGWLWHCDNPVKVLSCQEAPLLCCAWEVRGDSPRLVVGSAAGWLSVVNLEGEELEETMSRFQIHSCEVAAVDCAADGATVVSGGADGSIVLWSHVTGFKLAAFTVHAAAIRTLCFSADAGLLAAGDAAGVVSAWDVAQGCLLSAAQVHDGLVSSVAWSSGSTACAATASGSAGSNGSAGGLSVISGGYDGAVSVLQVDPSISRLYCAAFCGLYHSCKKTNKMRKLEAVLSWHLQQGALQDASVLQLLLMQAAADGNAATLGLLLPLFEQHGWLVHFGPIFARPSALPGPGGPAAIRKTDSSLSLLAHTASKAERRTRGTVELDGGGSTSGTAVGGALDAAAGASGFSAVVAAAAAAASAPAPALQPYHPGSGSVGVAANGLGLGLEQYVIHPHDRAKQPGASRSGGQSPSRRNTADRSPRNTGEGRRRSHQHSSSFGDGFSGLDGAVVSEPRNSRWAHSVADIKSMLAFKAGAPLRQQQQQGQAAPPPQQQRQQQQLAWSPLQLQRLQQLQSLPAGVRQAASPAEVPPAQPAASSPPAPWLLCSSGGGGTAAGEALQLAGADDGASYGGSMALSGLQHSVSFGGCESDTSGAGGLSSSPGLGPDSPCSASPAVTPTTLTPTRMLSPSVSRNARTPALLPSLDTLHEESRSVEEHAASGASGGQPRLPAAAAPAAQLSRLHAGVSVAAAAVLAAAAGAGAAAAAPSPAGDADDACADGSCRSSPSPTQRSPGAWSATHAGGAAAASEGGDAAPHGAALWPAQAGRPLGLAAAAADAGTRFHHAQHLPSSPLGRGGSSINLFQQAPAEQQTQQAGSRAGQLATAAARHWLRRWQVRKSGGGGAPPADERAGGDERHSCPLHVLGHRDSSTADHDESSSGGMGTQAAAAGAGSGGGSSDSQPDVSVTIAGAAAACGGLDERRQQQPRAQQHLGRGTADALLLHQQQHHHQLGARATATCDSAAPRRLLHSSSARAFLMRLASSISRLSSRASTADGGGLPDAGAISAAASALDIGPAQSAPSLGGGGGAAAGGKGGAALGQQQAARLDRGLGASKRRLLASWASWRNSGKFGSRLQSQPPTLLQRPHPASRALLRGAGAAAAVARADLLQVALSSQQAHCVRLVVDALLAGRFSKVSVVLHLYDALQALIHDPQHKRTCRRLLKHLPMIDNGEVEVDSLLIHNTKVLYKCAAHGHPGNLWSDATSSHQALLDALDVLVKRSSWRDSIVALLMWPVLWGLRHLGAAWLWLWARQGLGLRQRVQVSATSKLIPVVHAANIRPGSRGNLLRQLLSANVDADLYGRELVRAIINVKWESFARAFLLMQFVQFLAFFTFFLAYMAVAVYGNDPAWSTRELLAHPEGRAALALACILMIMMFGQAADEGKQMVTYRQDYFNSPWNYMDVASIVIIAILFLLHISRLNHQLFIILVALEVLLLCLRALYFCMALKVGALLRMVLTVMRDMRYFFLLLAFLLVSFGLTFSVLMSPATRGSLSLVSLAGAASSGGGPAESEVQVFGSLEDSILQLFTIMFGDFQFSTLKTIMSVNTVAARLAVFMAAIYAVLVLIVLVNLLISIVDETYGAVKESEADQILRNKALVIDEIESTLTDAVIADLNARVLLPYVHVLVPQTARPDHHAQRRDVHAKLRKLKAFMRQGMAEQAAANADALAALSRRLAAAAADGAAPGGAHAAHAHSSGGGPGGPLGPRPGAASPPAATAAAAAAAAAAAGALARSASSGGGGARSHAGHLERSASAGVGGAGGRARSPFRRSSTSAGGSQALVVVPATATAAATAMAAAPGQPHTDSTGHLQQELGQLAGSVSDLQAQVQAAGAASAAAVSDLGGRLEGLQGDVAEMKQLLLALLSRQQG